MAQIRAQQSLQEPNMDQLRPNIGSIYSQHGPDMIQKRRVPFGPGKGLKGTRHSWPQYSLQEPNMDQHRPNISSIYCETWMRLCQANWQENKRNVPKSPLLTARRGGLTVYATPWSQKWDRHFGSLSFFGNIYCGPVFGAGFWPHFWDRERATRSCATVLTARISSICWRQPSFCNASRHGHTHPYNTL